MIKTILLSIIIGIIYTVLLMKTSEIIFSDQKYDNKVQNTLAFLFVISIIGLIISHKLLTNDSLPIKFGLTVGSVILLFYSLVINWDLISNNTKLLILLGSFAAIIYYTKTSAKKDKLEEAKKLKKELKKEKEKLKELNDDTEDTEFTDYD